MKAIILVLFGSANLKGINESIDLLEDSLREKFGDEYSVFKAFTSKRIIALLKERHDYIVPHISELLFNLGNDGYKEVIVQPLHMMEGKDTDNIKEIINEYKYSFKKITLCNTLLSYDEKNMMSTINDFVKGIYDEDEKGIILLAGHGSKVEDNRVYYDIEREFNKLCGDRAVMATLEGDEKIDNIIEKLKSRNEKNIVIKPLFIIPGKHIVEDILEGENSWVAKLVENEFNVTTSKRTLLKYKKIVEMYIKNINEIVT